MNKSKRKNASLNVAYHEAGHAVASWWLDSATDYDLSFEYVTIVPNDHSVGHMRYETMPTLAEDNLEDDPKLRDYTERMIIIIFAGFVAEKRFTGRGNHVGADHDFRNAHALATQFQQTDECQAAYMKWLFKRSEALIDRFWPYVEELAKQLHQRQTLSWAESLQILVAHTNALYGFDELQLLEGVLNATTRSR
jgi:hypothetical protein